jgi:flagellar hook-length control protein FliK
MPNPVSTLPPVPAHAGAPAPAPAGSAAAAEPGAFGRTLQRLTEGAAAQATNDAPRADSPPRPKAGGAGPARPERAVITDPPLSDAALATVASAAAGETAPAVTLAAAEDTAADGATGGTSPAPPELAAWLAALLGAPEPVAAGVATVPWAPPATPTPGVPVHGLAPAKTLTGTPGESALLPAAADPPHGAHPTAARRAAAPATESPVSALAAAAERPEAAVLDAGVRPDAPLAPDQRNGVALGALAPTAMLSAPLPASPLTAANAAPAADAFIATPLADPAFAPALGTQIAHFARDGIEHARLRLNPAEMGPIAVQLVMDGQQVRVELVADLAATRQALEQSLPALASALRDAGFTLSGGGVFQQGRDGGQPGAARDGQAPPQSAPSPGALAGSDAPGGVPLPPGRAARTQGLVDLFA